MRSVVTWRFKWNSEMVLFSLLTSSCKSHMAEQGIVLRFQGKGCGRKGQVPLFPRGEEDSAACTQDSPFTWESISS